MTPPNDLDYVQPLDIIDITETHYEVSIPESLHIHTSPQTPLATWQQYITMLPIWDQQILHGVTTDIMSIWESLLYPNTLWHIASDGSYKDGRASYAWTLHTTQSQYYNGTGQVFGNPITAFRAELFGMCAWYCALHHVIQYLQLENTIKIQPFTDNTKVIHYHKHIIQGIPIPHPYNIITLRSGNMELL